MAECCCYDDDVLLERVYSGLFQPTSINQSHIFEQFSPCQYTFLLFSLLMLSLVDELITHARAHAIKWDTKGTEERASNSSIASKIRMHHYLALSNRNFDVSIST